MSPGHSRLLKHYVAAPLIRFTHTSLQIPFLTGSLG